LVSVIEAPETKKRRGKPAAITAKLPSGAAEWARHWTRLSWSGIQVVCQTV
jgi:hypothetical protein